MPDTPASPLLRRARAPRALVVSGPEPSDATVQVDWSFWHLTDEVAKGRDASRIDSAAELRGSLEQWVEERSLGHAHVGGESFFGWIREHPLVRVLPDAYLLRDAPPLPLPATFQVDVGGHRAPAFAVEFVAFDAWEHDYQVLPAKYAHLGCRELLLVDREAEGRDGRFAFQLFQRADDGAFVRAHAGGGAVWSRELEVWLVGQGDASSYRVSLARDASGRVLVQDPSRSIEGLRRENEELKRRLDAAKRELEAVERAKAAGVKGGAGAAVDREGT